MLASRLNPGDTIGVVAPSTPVDRDDPKFIHGVSYLESLGFEVKLGEHLFSRQLGYSATAHAKAADINSLFAYPYVRAIVCAQGGDTANACLPYLDYELIGTNPKILTGISDITVLLNALYARTGLVTFLGNDLMWGFGRTPTAYDREEFMARLVEGQTGPLRANGPRQVVRPGTGVGRLLGGNLRCLLKLAGTPYFPDFEGAILLVESLGFDPADCDAMFQQLKQMGVFESLQGVIIGYIDGADNIPDAALFLQDILLQVTDEYNFPILKTVDFGHNCPNTVLPVGTLARLDTDSGEIALLEPFVL